jgi:hypothetical protein
MLFTPPPILHHRNASTRPCRCSPPHPNIIRIYGFCLEPPNVCIITELLPWSLKSVLYHTGEARSRARSIAGTIASASETGGQPSTSYLMVGMNGQSSSAPAQQQMTDNPAFAQTPASDAVAYEPLPLDTLREPEPPNGARRLNMAQVRP